VAFQSENTRSRKFLRRNALVGGGERGIRTLLTRFSNMVMAWDFWQQASTSHQLAQVQASARVLGKPRESTPVLATLWQRRD
jgi:hypothetical protein